MSKNSQQTQVKPYICGSRYGKGILRSSNPRAGNLSRVQWQTVFFFPSTNSAASVSPEKGWGSHKGGICLSRFKLSAAAQLPPPGFILIAPLIAPCLALGYQRIMEYPMLEETHRDHWVHIPLNLQLLDRRVWVSCVPFAFQPHEGILAALVHLQWGKPS